MTDEIVESWAGLGRQSGVGEAEYDYVRLREVVMCMWETVDGEIVTHERLVRQSGAGLVRLSM